MLARLDSGYQDYDIFLHERDQFWPRSDMFSFGQSEPVSLPAGTELEAVFTMKDRAVNEVVTIFGPANILKPPKMSSKYLMMGGFKDIR